MCVPSGSSCSHPMATLVHHTRTQMSYADKATDVLPDNFDYDTWYYSGYSLFCSGLSVGLTNVASG